LEAALMLGLARLAVLALPFRWVARACGGHLVESPEEVPSADEETAAHIAWAVHSVRQHTPWNSNCLAQGIAGQQMLRLRGIESTLYIGIDNNIPRSFETHAWLRHGNKILTGAGLKPQYTAFVSYARVAD
jgi:hypothetical protein